MKIYTVEVLDNGTKYWYLNGKLHREDGPAIEVLDNGTKCWYLNDKQHREDGPAVEYSNGTKYWCLNGKLHREDGPAVEDADGTKSWYLNGEKLTEEEFLANTAKTVIIIIIDGIKYRLPVARLISGMQSRVLGLEEATTKH
jgi:antitoxin component YwqK of YwqJK toxin-antitoxin module